MYAVYQPHPSSHVEVTLRFSHHNLDRVNLRACDRDVALVMMIHFSLDGKHQKLFQN